MEKDQSSASGTSAQGFAPLPSAPPSYEEAVGYTSTAVIPPINTTPYPVSGTTMPMPMSSPNNSTPYPVVGTTMPMPMQMPMPMPMPNAYNQAPKQPGMPQPSNYSTPGTHANVQQPFNNADRQNVVPPSEVRIIHQRLTYSLGPHAVKLTCPSCHADIKTTTISDHQPSAHICCIVLCLLGCCLCSCLPYCMRTFMSVHHFCPNCKNYIGTWKG